MVYNDYIPSKLGCDRPRTLAPGKNLVLVPLHPLISELVEKAIKRVKKTKSARCEFQRAGKT